MGLITSTAMKIRTQLAVAFLLLAVLPLTSIVLFSYFTSARAVKRAVEAETILRSAEMDQRMKSIRRKLERGLGRLGRVPFTALLRGPHAAPSERQVPDRLFIERLMTEMGDAAPYLESLTVVPRPAASEPPPVDEVDPAVPVAPKAPEPPEPLAPASPEAGADVPMRPLRIDVVRLMEDFKSSQEEVETTLEIVEEEGEELAAEIASGSAELAIIGLTKALEAVAHAGDEEAQKKIEEDLNEEVERHAEALGNRFEKMAERYRTFAAVRAEEFRRAQEERRRAERLLGQDLGLEIRDQGAVVAEVQAQVSAEMLIHRVLSLTPRESGEIPFALDGEGLLYPAVEDDRPLLESLELERDPETQQARARRGNNEWLIGSTMDPGTGLVFGVAHPIGDSLAEIRETTARNFGLGLAFIALALFGILPLSRRITRGLESVTEGAERIARGDLSTRVPVESNNEIGQLAVTFNQMAEDLKGQQQRLVEEEGKRKEQEIEKRYLEAEFQRKSRELEDAREFQLSLLPKALPQHPAFDVAVDMQTAAEVGGDYYDYRRSDDGVLTLAIGDATGHGARAGTMVTVIKSLFSSAGADMALSDFLRDASSTVKRMDLGRMAMALTVVRLEGDRLTLSAAGMPPALLYRATSGGVEELELAGMPLGGLASGYEERRATFHEGDVLLLFSDGLPELPNDGGEPFGYPAVRETLAGAASGTPEEVIEAMTGAAARWADGKPPSDDMTFLVVKKLVGRADG